MATIAELEKQIADLNRQIKSAQGSRQGGLKEREEAAEFTRQLIQRAEAAGDQAKAEREINVLSNILQEISVAKQEIAGLEAQRDQLQQELNTQKAAEQSQQATTATQQNNTQSAGQEVKQSGEAGVTNPAPPAQTFTSPDAATTTATQPDPVVAVSNSNTPAIGTSPSPSPDATAATTQTNAEEAVGQQKVQTETFTDANRQGTDRSTKQSYVFYATEITSEFRQGRFEQTLEGCLYIFPRPKTSQVVDPPVRAADLGSQNFGLNNNATRVNTGTKKVTSAQNVRKATITGQTFPLKDAGTTPTNTRITAQDNTPDSRFFGF